MPRSVSPTALALLSSAQVRPALFLEIEFENETIYVWNGIGAVSAPGPAYDPSATFPYGTTFTGIGWFGQIKAIPQVTDVVAQNIILQLSGIPVELVSDAINAVRQSSQATVWIGVLDALGNIIQDPVQVFLGHLDVPSISEGATTCTISITAENPLIDLNRAPNRRYTDIDQQTDYPGDTGFFQVQLLQDYLITWPSPVPGDSASDTTLPPSSMVIQPGQAGPVIIAVGGTVQLVATVTRSDGQQVIVMQNGAPGPDWGGPVYSLDPGIATISTEGLVTGVKAGMTVITKRYVESMYLGAGSNRPSNCVTASVTIIVTD